MARPGRDTAVRRRLSRLLALGAAAACSWALAQQVQAPAPAQPLHPSVSASSAASHPAGVRAPVTGTRTAQARPASNGPLWVELTTAQRQALAPLAGTWDTVSEAQKRKWLAMSVKFPKLAPDEQAKLHSRMSEWVALSPQQRTQARLSFGEAKQLSADDKKAKWEAYQALPPEEKRKLAAGAAKPPQAAAAVKPVPAARLATLPKQVHQPDSKGPRIAVAPNQVDHNTLLPQALPAAPAGPN